MSSQASRLPARVRRVVYDVALENGVPPSTILARSNQRLPVECRAIVAYRLRKLDETCSYPALGKLLGGYDSATIQHLVKVVAPRLGVRLVPQMPDSRPRLVGVLEELENKREILTRDLARVEIDIQAARRVLELIQAEIPASGVAPLPEVPRDVPEVERLG